MDTKQTLSELKNRHCYSMKRLSSMLGISPKRIAEIQAGYDPTKEETHKVEVLKKFAIMSGRGVNFEDEIAFEKKQLATLDERLHETIKRICVDPESETAIETCVCCIKSESMYLGMFYSNANMEEKVYEEVRKARKIIGNE